MAQGLGDRVGSLRSRRLVAYFVLVLLPLVGSVYLAGSVLDISVMTLGASEGILLLACLLLALKLPICLLVFSLVLLVFSTILGPKVGSLQDRKSRYIWSVVLSMLIISTIGAFVDILFIYAASDVTVIPGVKSQAIRWTVATVLTFLSLFVISDLLIGLRPEPNLWISAIVSLANSVIWYMASPLDAGIDMIVPVVYAAVLVDIVVLTQVAAWHERRYLREPMPPPRLTIKALFRVSATYFATLSIVLILAVYIVWVQPDEDGPFSSVTLVKSYDTWHSSWKFSVSSMNVDLPWSDVTIALTDGGNWTSWTNISSSDLDDETLTEHNYSAGQLSGQEVTLTIVDLAGNGRIDEGDYFTLEASSFCDDVTYTVTMVYDPTNGEIAHSDFEL